MHKACRYKITLPNHLIRTFLTVTVILKCVFGSLSWRYTHAAYVYLKYLISFLLHYVGGITWPPSQSGCFGEEISLLSLPEIEP